MDWPCFRLALLVTIEKLLWTLGAFLHSNRKKLTAPVTFVQRCLRVQSTSKNIMLTMIYPMYFGNERFSAFGVEPHFLLFRSIHVGKNFKPPAIVQAHETSPIGAANIIGDLDFEYAKETRSEMGGKSPTQLRGRKEKRRLPVCSRRQKIEAQLNADWQFRIFDGTVQLNCNPSTNSKFKLVKRCAH